MLDPVIYLLFAVIFMAMFFGTVPLVVAFKRGDQERIDKILDLYIEVFVASAGAIIGALKIFRRKETPNELRPPGDGVKMLSPPQIKQLEPP